MKVVITGYGVISPFGAGVERMMQGLERGECRVRSLGTDWNGDIDGTYCRLGAPVDETLDLKAIPRKNRRSMSRGAQFAQLATNEALATAQLSKEVLSSGRAGVAFGSTITGPCSLADFYEDFLIKRSIRNVPANGFFRVMGNSTAANVANCLGVTGRVHSTPAACASGAIAIGLGFEFIRSGAQDVMICGGEEELHPSTTAIFDTVGAASSHFNDQPEKSPAPFDKDRDGTVCGEGSGALILESEDHALRRGATILGRVLGFGCAADGENMAHPGSRAMVRCMQLALADAEIDAARVGYVSAHGTGTIHGDRAESEAIHEVFGDSTPVSSLKGFTGHTLGASGAIEAVATLEMMQRGLLIPTAKLRNVDPECAGVHHLQALEHTPVDLALKCCFGFGGSNGAVLLGRKD